MKAKCVVFVMFMSSLFLFSQTSIPLKNYRNEFYIYHNVAAGKAIGLSYYRKVNTSGLFRVSLDINRQLALDDYAASIPVVKNSVMVMKINNHNFSSWGGRIGYAFEFHETKPKFRLGMDIVGGKVRETEFPFYQNFTRIGDTIMIEPIKSQLAQATIYNSYFVGISPNAQVKFDITRHIFFSAELAYDFYYKFYTSKQPFRGNGLCFVPSLYFSLGFEL